MADEPDLARVNQRALAPAEVARVDRIKQAANSLAVMIGNGTRESSLARTKLEECVFWAVKGVTTP